MENAPHLPGDTFHPSSTESVTPLTQATDTPKKKRSKKAFLFFAAVILLVVIGLLVWKLLIPAIQFRAPSSVANKFVSAITNNNAQDAYNLTTESYRSKITQQQLQQTLDSAVIKSIGKDNINLASRKNIGENPAKAEFRYAFSHSGKEYFIKLTVIEQDKKWLIDDAVLSADTDGFQRNNTGN